MKKVIFIITSLVMLIGCTPKEYILNFEDLDIWSFSDCIKVDDFEQTIQIMKSFDLTNCVVKIKPEGDFNPESFKESVKMSAYNLNSMSDEPGTPEDFNNKGRLVTPYGNGVLEIYNSNQEKVVELLYQDSMPYSIKLWNNNSLFYEADGVFDIEYFEGSSSYVFISGKAELIFLPD